MLYFVICLLQHQDLIRLVATSKSDDQAVVRPRPVNQGSWTTGAEAGWYSVGTSSLLWEAPFLSLQTPPPPDSPTKENHQKPSSTFLVVVSFLKLPAAQVPSKHTLAGHTLSLWGTRHHPASTGYLRFLPPLARTCGFFLPLANLALIPGGQRSHRGELLCSNIPALLLFQLGWISLTALVEKPVIRVQESH